MIITYKHHNQIVFVNDALLGQHRNHCLCWQGCAKFKPGQDDNCPIAQAVYNNCVRFNLVTPVYECPEYTQKEKQ